MVWHARIMRPFESMLTQKNTSYWLNKFKTKIYKTENHEVESSRKVVPNETTRPN